MKLAFPNLDAVGEGAFKRQMLSSQLQRVCFNGIGKSRLNSKIVKAPQLIRMCHKVLTSDVAHGDINNPHFNPVSLELKNTHEKILKQGFQSLHAVRENSND